MQEVYVIDAVRTAVGKFGGTLASIRPDDLATEVLKAIVERNNTIDYSELDEVILGAANQAGEDNRNVARMASLMAKIPENVPGYTVNRLCASGLLSIGNAFMAIKSGMSEMIIAGGVESMSRAPWVMAKPSSAWDRKPEVVDTTIGWRFTNPKLAEMHYPFGMGETAENVAERWLIKREEQDLFAYNSQKKYLNAHNEGRFNTQIIPVNIPQRKKEDLVFIKDEHPRLSEPEILAKLKPAFKKDGSVTAGNSSGINDGASAILLASEAMVKKYNLQPIAKVLSSSAAGVSPDIMGIGPVPATQKALKLAHKSVKDLDLVELNEAFASQSIACMRDLDLDPEIVNVNGGSIAIGHPLGASGARIATTLLHEMKRTNRNLGLATMCVGVGQGQAVIFERV
jgi:acetyl-CoA C-acetyltransferase